MTLIWPPDSRRPSARRRRSAPHFPRRRPETQKTSDTLTILRQALRRPLTEREAEDLLARSGFAREEIAAALAEARELAWIDDRVFARLWVEDRLLHHPLSRRAIEQELRGRKVSHDVASAAVQDHYPEERERDVARDLARERLARLHNLDEMTQRRRTVDFLIRRGFSSSVAADSVRRALAGSGYD